MSGQHACRITMAKRRSAAGRVVLWAVGAKGGCSLAAGGLEVLAVVGTRGLSPTPANPPWGGD